MAAPFFPAVGRLTMSFFGVSGIQNGMNGCRVHMFANNYYPDQLAQVANFTESLAAGLGGQPLGLAANLGQDITGRQLWQFPTVNFRAFGAGLPVIGYGYWVDAIYPPTGVRTLIWCQRWAEPFAWLAPGNNYALNLTLGGNQC